MADDPVVSNCPGTSAGGAGGIKRKAAAATIATTAYETVRAAQVFNPSVSE
jgi:hypothetical protein